MGSVAKSSPPRSPSHLATPSNSWQWLVTREHVRALRTLDALPTRLSPGALLPSDLVAGPARHPATGNSRTSKSDRRASAAHPVRHRVFADQAVAARHVLVSPPCQSGTTI